MMRGPRINGEEFSLLWEKKVDLGAGGVAFYSGRSESDADIEARLWIDSLLHSTPDSLLVPH